jgi:hypothetical protein
LTFKTENQIKLPYVIDFIKKQNLLNNSKNTLKTSIDYNLTKKIDELAKNTIEPIRWK